MSKAAVRAVVSGRVQGVFYRMFVLREAQALGLCGRVRNRADGTVEVVAEGERSSLEQLVAKLHKGPPAAVVSQVVLEWEEYTHEYDDFAIAYD